MFPDQDALKGVCLGKQRTSHIIRQVFGKHLLNELCAILRERLFSIIIGETTNRSTTKQLSVIAQYFDDGKMRIHFLT